MYKANVNITLRIKGCPAKGIEAVEFRRKHGLAVSPCNGFPVRYTGEDDRSLCEEHRGMLTDSADLIIYDAGIKVEKRTPEISPEVLKAYEQSGDIAMLLRHVMKARKTLQDELDAEAAQAAADRVLAREKAIRELLAMDADQLAGEVLCGKDLQLNLNHRFRTVLAADDASYGRGFPEAKYTHPDCEGVMGLIQMARNIAVAKAKEAAEEKTRHMREWIANHGSERLRRAAKEVGYTREVVDLYQDERIAVERQGWVWYGNIDEETSPTLGVCPETQDLDMLAKAREFEPDARLMRLSCDGSDYLVAEATYLGRTIIYGYRAE